jgi:hypothetical protein
MRRRIVFHRAAASAVLALLVAACAGGEKGRDGGAAADSAANARAAANGTTPAGDEIDVEELKLGRALKADSSVAAEVDDFRPRDTVYAVMETDANESGKQVTVRWTMGDNNQLVSEETRTVATGESARTVFRGKQGGWAPGKYHVRILYNGKEVKSADFEVE